MKREKNYVLLHKLRESLRSMSRQFLSNVFVMMLLLEVSSTLNKTLVFCCSFQSNSWKFMFISLFGRMEIIYKVNQKHLFKAGPLFPLFPLVHPTKHSISVHQKCEGFGAFLHFYHRKLKCQSKTGQQLWSHAPILPRLPLSQDDVLLMTKSNKGKNTAAVLGSCPDKISHVALWSKSIACMPLQYRNILIFEYLKGICGIAVQSGFLYILSLRNQPEHHLKMTYS